MAVQLLAVLGIAGVMYAAAKQFPPVSRCIDHTANRLLPNERLNVGDALELLLRDVVDVTYAKDELLDYGINEERAALLYKLKEQLVGINELITLWRREEIGNAELEEEAAKLGWTKERLQSLVKFTETRPGVQDIIRFAVREVYSPDISAAFGQYEGAAEVADAAEPDLKAAGISKDTLSKYWAAHWDLPSVSQGFEMLHRGIIEDEHIDLLLRALDVMPFWRDKLKKISYNPLTRVDVRRMHKLGILDDEAVYRAYRDIGYNDEHAKNMTEFTILYNADPEEAETTEKDKEIAKNKDLTKSDILGGYEDGIFGVEDTREALSMLGYDTNEVDYYVARVDMKRDRDLVTKFIKFYKDAYISNVMAFDQVNDKLAALNLSGDRINMLFALWDAEKQFRTAKPTKAEVLSFLRKGILDEGTARTELLGLGYDYRYVDWYIASAK